jgi:hypothetical protein
MELHLVWGSFLVVCIIRKDDASYGEGKVSPCTRFGESGTANLITPVVRLLNQNSERTRSGTYGREACASSSPAASLESGFEK